METKICTKCGEEKPATAEYFNRGTRGKYGVRAYCKVCEKEYNKEYYEKNTEKYKQKYKQNADNIKQYNKERSEEKAEYNKQYYKKNANKIKEQSKRYYEDNKEAHKEYYKTYYDENTDTYTGYSRQYYKKNKEKIEKRKKKYRKENAEKIKKQKRRYYRENKDLFSIKKQKRRAVKKSLPSTLTLEQWGQIKDEFSNRCSYCGKKKKLEQEHFIPLSKGGEYTHNNIIPACKFCNSSKRDKDFFEWYPEQEFYSKEREQKILNHLGYEEQTQQLALI